MERVCLFAKLPSFFEQFRISLTSHRTNGSPRLVRVLVAWHSHWTECYVIKVEKTRIHEHSEVTDLFLCRYLQKCGKYLLIFLIINHNLVVVVFVNIFANITALLHKKFEPRTVYIRLKVESALRITHLRAYKTHDKLT